MHSISFHYNGKTFESEVEFSLHKQPNYYWCYLNDPELVGELGKNCILFLNYNGSFKTPHYYPVQYKPMINSLQESIKQHFESTRERV
jgi:hypothetical protein